jgi:hypothetical protein
VDVERRTHARDGLGGLDQLERAIGHVAVRVDDDLKPPHIDPSRLAGEMHQTDTGSSPSPHLTPDVAREPAGIRTQDQGIKSPLLYR